MAFPSAHFPGTPKWVRAAVAEAVAATGVNASKWTVPLEAIGRYESNYRPIANMCKPVEENWPLGIMQLARGMFKSARSAGLIPSTKFDDPVQQFAVAILYIDSQLSGYGGYQGIGTLDSKKGLLSRDDRGPRGVLLAWQSDPDHFDVEAAREKYRGY